MTIDLPLCVEDAQEILAKIVKAERFENPKITYSSGSKMGEGYMAINTAVEISNGADRNLHLFVKAAPKHLKLREISATRISYANELRFYEIIFPKIAEFYREKTGRVLEFAPKFYAGSYEEMKEMLVMENLKRGGFALNGIRNVFGKEEMLLIMRKYGEFHGTSFALKDQNRREFETITGDLPDFFYLLFKSMGLSGLVKYRCKLMEKYLESPEDDLVLGKVKFLAANIDEFFRKVRDFKGGYRTILHGDCWSNNMMFRRDKGNLQIRLLDFQGVRLNSPALDLSYVFYASASSEENLSQLDYYLDVYHRSLSLTIRELGSDPDKLYPKSALEEDWRNFSLFGLVMAVMVMAYVVDESESAPNIVEFAEGKGGAPVDFIDTISEKNRKDFAERIKLIVRHFIVKGFI